MKPDKYWAARTAKTMENLTTKSIRETERQLTRYYGNAMRKIIGQFEQTYDKLLSTLEKDKPPTPADLYKLDKYWQMQAQLQKELQQLGYNQLNSLSESFVTQYMDIYQALALNDEGNFNSIDSALAQQMINQIWCADGKSWSERVWANTAKLQEALNDNLIDCVVAGKKTTDLKNMLQEQFGVSYNRADSIVRTEMAHIQTQAAKKRYEDYGIREVEILADEDERRCEVCGNLHEKRFPIGAAVPLPAHPKCRCCIIPVVD